MIRPRPLATPAADPVAGVTPAQAPTLTLTRRDRDLLAAYAGGTSLATLSRRHRRAQVARLVHRAAGDDRDRAGAIVAAYDALAAVPVAELSPIRKPDPLDRGVSR